ncbi:hypothetical protein CHZ71_001659 [Escherichia coli]|nr:hypothetical protein [Escherichia coli]EFF6683331.1 hypothetical protein [Escherichia coli]EFJ4442666.1 hypothetical protein [Escherichia coli]EHD4840946.1 hypothetical protein [Escherichia coli]EHI0298216.1 hypothetical protein [Escherichia coli]
MLEHIVVFDVCGTLYLSNTTFDYVVFVHRKQKKYTKLIKCLLLRSLFGKLLHKLRICSLRKHFLKTLEGYEKSILEELANLFYDEFLIFKEKNEVMALLERYKHEKIILMSASVDTVINVIAKKLNVEAVSSKLEFIDNKSTGLLEYNLKGIKHLQTNNPVSLIVTDNFSDINLIKLADTAVIISKAKDKNKWRVLLNRFGVSKDKVRFM